MSPRVLFVSKPIVPPYHDGTKCLVRDVASYMSRFEPLVLSTPSGPGLPADVSARVRACAVYGSSGAFTPKRADNARAALFLVAKSRADLWHFVFAPNAATSSVGHIAKAIRRVPVVQTIASPPRTFEKRLFFGDIVVAQSRWTRDRAEAVLQGSRRLAVIPPPVARLSPRSAHDRTKARRALDIDDDALVFVYPGDLEAGTAAETVARSVVPLVRAHPRAVVVFACRHKTPRAPEIQRALAARLDAARVRFAGETTELISLMDSATAILFPVDDLFGKVDLPISLLEAMQLGVPVVAYDYGPISDLSAAVLVKTHDEGAFVEKCIRLGRDTEYRASVAAAQKKAVEERYAAPRVAAAYEELYAELLMR